MLRYILSRLIQSIVVLLIVVTMVFFMVKMTPGNPMAADKASSKYVVAQNNKIFGFDKPLGQQYFIYLGKLMQGEMGWSLKAEGRAVSEIIAESFPISLRLGLLAIAIAILIGTPLGVIGAVKQNTWADYVPMSLAMMGVCIPTFVMGPFLAVVFGLKLGWVNVAGIDQWSDWILPATTMGLFYAAYFARLARAGMLEVLSQDYIRTAKAKGVPGWRIVVFHALRGGLLPLLSFLGPALAGIVVGSFVIEGLFGSPGLGRHFTEAALNKDYSLVLGTSAFYCALLVAANLAVDVLQVMLNPRLRFAQP